MFHRLNINFQVWGLRSPPPPPVQDDILAFVHSTQKMKHLLCIFTSKNIASTATQLAAFLRRSLLQLCGDVMVVESTSKKLKKQQEAVQEGRLVVNAEESSSPQGLEHQEQRVTGGRLILDPTSSFNSSLQVPSTLPNLLIDPL